MRPTRQLHEAGQSLWLDNITRGLLDHGTLQGYLTEDSVTGLTSNPTIFDKAIEGGPDYDTDIAARKSGGASDEEVFFELALADLRRAADMFAPVHARSDGVDGWVSLEVSPLLVHDTRGFRGGQRTSGARGCAFGRVGSPRRGGWGQRPGRGAYLGPVVGQRGDESCGAAEELVGGH